MSSRCFSRPRLAQIGVTGYGTIYFDLLRKAHDRGLVDVEAAVVINPEEAAAAVADLRRMGAAIYADYEDMLRREAGKIDVCLIPTGIQWHARMTIAALRAGMNVLVEKPLAGSVADALAIRQAEKETGRWVAVGFQDIYASEAIWVKEQICAGVIGRVEAVRMIGLWPRPRGYFCRNPWAGRLQADGAPVRDSPLNNAFAHFVNLALFFAGAAPDEMAEARVESAELYRVHDIESFDTAVVRAVSAEGVQFWFGVSHSTEHTRQPEIYVIGSKGRVEWWHEQRCIVLKADGGTQVFPLPDTAETRQSMFQAVLDRLHDPDARICTTAMALQHTKLIESLHAVGEVRTLPADHYEWLEASGPEAAIASIRGLDEAMERARIAHSRLADCRIAAVPLQRVS